MNQAPYLLGRIADPLFAIAIGTLSYYSYERKVARPEGHSLNELISKRFSKNI
uniref:Non-classical export protein 1 n=1 Tax=Zygosaccharomyces rouxii TaxID=4956 RepID=B2G4Q2_ZYGRO|nr:Non-classical export protein 1 [Zygosaccharomyces rouxii]